MDKTDTDCINAYLGGDANALEPMVEKYKRPLYSFILKMTEGREDADEIFQETWFRALKNIHKFQHKNFLNWLFRIAHNLVIDRARRNKKNVSMQSSMGGEDGDNTLEDHLAAPGISPAEEAGGAGLGEQIDEAVKELSPDQKEVFMLRMYGNTSFKEIAQIQKCSINTCLARMQYALTKLRSILKEEYDELQEAMS
ncbi:sigma-70 family RNA polymerase sigma factor [Pontiella sulfatireligans]|uniref:ECF RNA polymerase sigma factor SigW n=1 Tax=Pontiella sulfatireligans TaxID=2750658 RepID=A0A6C2UJE2_9BACT|nr:sigma-70 family RNA polymerase sigma factor [Pontiella sulfatireligans]VGO19434.1 ECF RNA polymerase sigma factor SigW [Pontiella sulfatireligans]